MIEEFYAEVVRRTHLAPRAAGWDDHFYLDLFGEHFHDAKAKVARVQGLIEKVEAAARQCGYRAICDLHDQPGGNTIFCFVDS